MPEEELLQGDDGGKSDAALDALIEEHKDEQPEPKKPARAKARKTKKKAVKKTVDDDPAPEPEVEAPEPEAEEEPEAPAIDPGDVDKAKRALKRVHVPESTIEGMLESDPDGFLEWGLRLAEEQEEVDQKFENHQNTARELSEIRRLISPKADTPAVSDQPDTIDSILEPLSQSDSYSEGDEVTKALKAVNDRFEARFAEQERLHESRLAEANARVEAVENGHARAALSEKYTQLQDEAGYSKVLETMKAIEGARPSGESHVQFMERATKLAFMDEMIAEADGIRSRTRKTRDVGSPRTGGRGVKRKGRTQEAAFEDSLDALVNEDVSGAVKFAKEVNSL